MSALKITKADRIVLSVHRIMEHISTSRPGELPYSIENEEKIPPSLTQQCGVLPPPKKRTASDVSTSSPRGVSNIFGPRKGVEGSRRLARDNEGENSCLGPWRFSKLRPRLVGTPNLEKPQLSNRSFPSSGTTTADSFEGTFEELFPASEAGNESHRQVNSASNPTIVSKPNNSEALGHVGHKSTIFLTLERIEFLLRMWPSGDELDALLEAKRANQPMMPVEALMADLVSVPNIKLLAEACVE